MCISDRQVFLSLSEDMVSFNSILEQLSEIQPRILEVHIHTDNITN